VVSGFTTQNDRLKGEFERVYAELKRATEV